MRLLPSLKGLFFAMSTHKLFIETHAGLKGDGGLGSVTKWVTPERPLVENN